MQAAIGPREGFNPPGLEPQHPTFFLPENRGRRAHVLIGRRTFELFGGGRGSSGMKTFVFSRTLRPQGHPGVTIVADGARELLRDLRAALGKDIRLFGGGELFESLLELDCVDSIEAAIVPVALGGRPLLPRPAARRRLSLA